MLPVQYHKGRGWKSRHLGRLHLKVPFWLLTQNTFLEGNKTKPYTHTCFYTGEKGSRRLGTMGCQELNFHFLLLMVGENEQEAAYWALCQPLNSRSHSTNQRAHPHFPVPMPNQCCTLRFQHKADQFGHFPS